jgi:hypothetical protein
MQKLINEILSRFRIADCEIFNKYFRVEEPWDNQEDAWRLLERFNDLEIILFQKMVSEALSIKTIQYGEPQENILICSHQSLPALINREISSGYWDHPSKEIPKSSEIQFISFFDWDAISIRDNKFNRARIISCPSNPSLTGKQALIESVSTSYYLRDHNKY